MAMRNVFTYMIVNIGYFKSLYIYKRKRKEMSFLRQFSVLPYSIKFIYKMVLWFNPHDKSANLCNARQMHLLLLSNAFDCLLTLSFFDYSAWDNSNVL